MQNNVGFIPVVSNFWTFFKPYEIYCGNRDKESEKFSNS